MAFERVMEIAMEQLLMSAAYAEVVTWNITMTAVGTVLMGVLEIDVMAVLSIALYYDLM